MKKFLLGVVIILFFLFLGRICFRLYWVSPAKDSPFLSFEISEGQTLPVTIKELQKSGLLNNPYIFKWYLKKEKLDKKIQIGIFGLQPNLSIRSLAKIITDPEAAVIKLTFPEGWNLRDYAHYLENQSLFMAEELNELVGFPAVDYKEIKDFPPLKNFVDKFYFLKDKSDRVSLEGYLFPDTYRFKKNIKLLEIVETLLKNFGDKINPYMAEINNQHKSINEIVIAASLIEAEAKTESDRRLISDIIWRRLDVGLPLQLDSTVNYITGNKKPAISLAEQTIESLFNTYKHTGLPLGPIDNPGLQSILAAIYPEHNDYWFFLTGKDGQMHYAKNLKEHNENKRKYLK